MDDIGEVCPLASLTRKQLNGEAGNCLTCLHLFPIKISPDSLVIMKRYLSDYPELVKEFHPSKNGELRPKDFTYGSSKKIWWKCSLNKSHCMSNAVENQKTNFPPVVVEQMVTSKKYGGYDKSWVHLGNRFKDAGV